MTDLLNSLKSDLTSRRMLPFVALLAVALLAAIAYALHSGSGASAPAPTAAAPSAVSPPAGSSPSVSQAPANSNAAVSETTSGTKYQRQGSARNPFISLVASSASKTTTAASGTKAAGSSTTSTKSQSGSSGSGGASTKPVAPKTTSPSKPKKNQPVYQVAVLFGVLPTTPGQVPVLTPYENIKRLTPLPSAERSLVAFMGVSSSAKSASFAVTGEAILHGNGVCVPSASQCELIDLTPGQTEELSYLEPSGQTVVYQLKVVSIVKSNKSASAAQSLYRRQSKVGQALLRHNGPPLLADLRFSMNKGVLVFVKHGGFGARAHSARGHLGHAH
jgi:hypothetical protein